MMYLILLLLFSISLSRLEQFLIQYSQYLNELTIKSKTLNNIFLNPKLTFRQNQTELLTMQNNQILKQAKTKCVKPQVFSVTGAVRSNNAAHCRSLVDLNNIQSNSAEKDNHHYTDHFSSIMSNQDNKPIPATKLNNGGKFNSSQTKQTSANISNIAKILMNHNNSKIINNIQSSKNTNFIQANINRNQKNPMTRNRKNQLFFDSNNASSNTNSSILNNMSKTEARTSSQTNLRQNNLRQNNGSLPKNPSNTTNNRIMLTSSLQKQRSEKSQKKLLTNQGQQTPNNHQLMQRQKISNNAGNSGHKMGTNTSTHSNSNTNINTNTNTNTNTNNQSAKCDYSLLIKLKQYIQDLKRNEQKNLQQIIALQQQNSSYKQQLILLRDKVQVYQIREKQMVKKIKFMEAEIHRMGVQIKGASGAHGNTASGNSKGNECHEHMLIIQSLKNVINEQMGKIIEMQTYKLQVQQHKQKQKSQSRISGGPAPKASPLPYIHQNFISHHNSKRNKNQPVNSFKNPDLSLQQEYLECQLTDTDAKHVIESQEVYSFKKRNNLNQSSIYGEDRGGADDPMYSPRMELNMNMEHVDESASGNCQNTHLNTNNFHKSNKYSQSSIPQPYNQLIKSLQTDSRLKQKPRQKQQPNNHTSNMQKIKNRIVANNENIDINLLSSERAAQRSSQKHYNMQQSDMGQIQMQTDRMSNGIASWAKSSTGKQLLRFKDQCSEDQILSQVGQYLQNIRRNIKEV